MRKPLSSPSTKTKSNFVQATRVKGTEGDQRDLVDLCGDDGSLENIAPLSHPSAGTDFNLLL